ncbi:MAG: GAF domain-containing sensor histidine kinase [Cytophagales bacterium]|nr:MAG: GAF domain-containing sensor histidine kinase [Cytophagales bacterium]
MNKINKSELNRVLALSNLGIDYFEPNKGLDNLVEIAAKVSGMNVSMINLIDSYTQWTVASVGIDRGQMAKEDSVCQYPMDVDLGDNFEIKDLSRDNRFKDKDYVSGSLQLKYYWGIPLKTNEGFSIGALCVLDKETKELSPNQEELLRRIANQIVDWLRINRLILELNQKLVESKKTNHKLAHDIRGPFIGIVGLGELIQSGENSPEENQEYLDLMVKGGQELLDMVGSLLKSTLSVDRDGSETSEVVSLNSLKDRLTQLFQPQALVKDISLKISVSGETLLSFSKIYALQILGNLISNAIKFTAQGGKVTVDLDLQKEEEELILQAVVTDTGLGMSAEKIREIEHMSAKSELGSQGEEGFGLGLMLVRSLLDQQEGKMSITSKPGEGTSFKVYFKVL